MKNFLSKLRAFLISERGPATIEYAILLALICIVCLASIGKIGKKSKTVFNDAAKSLVAKKGGS